MNVSCPECRSVFRVDPAKVPDGGIRARCSVCGGIIRIAASSPNADFADVPPSIARATPIRRLTPVFAPSAQADVAAGGTPAASESASAPPAIPDEGSAHGSDVRDSEKLDLASRGADVPSSAHGNAPDDAADPVDALPDGGTTPENGDDSGAEFEGGPVAPAESPAEAPVRSAAPAPYIPRASDDRQGSPSGAGWGRSAPAWPSSPDARSAQTPNVAPAAPRVEDPAPSAHVPQPRTTAPTVPRVAPRQPTPPAGSATPGTARRPLNPFLANDRNVKAKRLARALVSDMVAYNPSEREAGVRDGSLKQRFREEIKKSYEEYVEQMGKEFAETTTHFQDALNDILAGGQRVF